jgi:serine/threonine protein kinase/tetratricopeptide (TPR) repeat protein
MMNPERWRRIDELFRTVADHPTAEREAHLTRVCGGDEELRREVLELLAHEPPDSFLHDQIKHTALAVTAETPDELLGQHIGPYRLTGLLGRGGMGAVYEAVRDDQQFDQRVALKLIKRGMDSEFVRQRFLRERQILAALDHPCIARLFDGGTTADGRPYFVMEFVAGQPITEYCRQHELSLAAKLKLFRAVCGAVQHAHQKLVVHRDLKPSNIMVAPATDGKADGKEGTPKLLDFGIAKLLTPDISEAHTRTETAVRLMTPEYASPEQVRGGTITTATDVYALGVVLYELLTGRRPYQFDTYAPLEIEHAICDTEAARPSEAVGQSLALGRQLTGDLDNIVMMAMRKEPERRYSSVEKFSEDIRRYLDGLPVTARADTFNYRAGKFVRRHKVGVAFVVTVLLMLAGVAITMTAQAARIARERDRANLAAATAEAATQSLVSVFEFADPGKSRGNPITAKELLDQGAEKVMRELKDQPAVQARLMDTIGGLYQSIGVQDRAQLLLEEALKLRRQTLGAEHADVADSLHHLARLAHQKGDFAGSETLFREALALRRKLLGTEHTDVADTMNGLGVLLLDRGNLGEADPLLREALALRRRKLGQEHKDVAESFNGLGRLLSKQGKFAEAAEMYGQALALYRKLFGEEHPYVAANLNTRAAMLHELGDYDGAEPLFREALALNRKLLGAEHPDIVSSLANLASLLQDKRQYEEAEQLYRQAVELRRKLFGENHPNLTITMNNLATLLKDKGDLAEAEALFRQTLALRRRLLGETHTETATTIGNLGGVYFDKGQYGEALRLYRQAFDIYLKLLQPDHWMVNRTRSQIGGCLTRLKRFREAEEQLLTAHAGLKTARGEEHALTRKTVSRLIELYDAWGKPDQAAPYRALPRAG